MERIFDLNNILNLSSQNEISKEIIKSLKNINVSDGYKKTFSNISKSFVFIFILINLQSIIQNPKDLFNSIKSMVIYLFKKMIYKKFIVNSKKIHHVLIYEKCIKKESILMYNKIENEKKYIYYIPWISKFTELKKSIIETQSKKTENINTCLYEWDVLKNSYSLVDNSMLCPSKNHVKLASIIEVHVNTSNITKCFKPIGILLNGPPGLGKSYSSIYIAGLNIVENCFHIKMSEMIDLEVKDIFKKTISNPVKKSSVYLIDELDKYLFFRIQKKYIEYIDSYMDSLKDGDIRRPKSFQEFETPIKLNIVIELIGLLDIMRNRAPCILIFCSNNFGSIFEGLDLTHIRSLFTRFFKINFDYCDKKELLNYLNYYNKCYINTPYNINENLIKSKIDEMDEFKISFRKLDEINTNCLKNPIKVIENIQDKINIQEEDDIEISIDPKKIINKMDEYSSKKFDDYINNLKQMNKFKKKEKKSTKKNLIKLDQINNSKNDSEDSSDEESDYESDGNESDGNESDEDKKEIENKSSFDFGTYTKNISDPKYKYNEELVNINDDYPKIFNGYYIGNDKIDWENCSDKKKYCVSIIVNIINNSEKYASSSIEKYALVFRIMNLFKNDNIFYNFIFDRRSFMFTVLDKLKEFGINMSSSFGSIYKEYFNPLINEIKIKMDIDNIDDGNTDSENIENKKN